MSKVYALVDCNSFFCSCERLFRPDLANVPVGVLSNNDGCFVSRTKELKKLGIKMGEPYFKVKNICNKNGVAVFSSNFSLYTNISDRVMLTLAKFTPELEVYSVDEAFLNLAGFSGLEDYAREIKRVVERDTGIPVSVGVGPTKTLAKVANHFAKKSEKADGVVILMEKILQDEALRRIAVGDIWGIGRASSEKLNRLGVKTGIEFRDYQNDKQIQKVFTKVGLQRKEELQGKPRFELELIPEKKKEIICSRTFGSSVFNFEGLRESVANYISSAAEKLRKQDSVCGAIDVYTRTSPHKNVPQYYGYNSCVMLSTTSDTRKMIKYAVRVLEGLYRAGYEYKKAGIKLSQIRNKNESQMSLLDPPDDWKSDILMKCMDQINKRDGAGTIFAAECGIQKKAWAMNRNFKSPRYVTGWTELRKLY